MARSGDRPLHAQQKAIRWVNWDISISSLYVKFGHQSSPAILGDHANNLIYVNVFHSEFVWSNPIINARPIRGGKVHNQTPFAGLPFFGNNTKTADMKTREGRAVKGPGHSPKRDFVRQISIDDVRMCIRGGLVPRSGF